MKMEKWKKQGLSVKSNLKEKWADAMKQETWGRGNAAD